jgi:predicted RNase H-like HicB family nuclease
MPHVHLRVLVLNEGSGWIAFSLEHYIMSQGDTAEEAAENFKSVLGAELSIAGEYKSGTEEKPLSGIMPTPTYLTACWGQGASGWTDTFSIAGVLCTLVYRVIR